MESGGTAIRVNTVFKPFCASEESTQGEERRERASERGFERVGEEKQVCQGRTTDKERRDGEEETLLEEEKREER